VNVFEMPPALCSPEEVIALVRCYQAGDEAAAAALVDAHMPLVWKLARKHAPVGEALEADDLVSTGALAVLNAARLFDVRKGVRFLTYAHWASSTTRNSSGSPRGATRPRGWKTCRR
jgi:DNA-directed RNA polymerase sigma subunit (sigma70/sigma32)